MKSYFISFVAICGMVGISYGAALVYVPAGFIVGGGFLLLTAIFHDIKDTAE